MPPWGLAKWEARSHGEGRAPMGDPRLALALAVFARQLLPRAIALGRRRGPDLPQPGPALGRAAAQPPRHGSAPFTPSHG